MSRYRKFLTALGGVVVLAGLEFGVDLSVWVERTAELVTAGLVFLIPNDAA